MKQEEIAQENEDVIDGEVVEEEIKDEQEDEAEIRKRMKYNAVFFLSLGILFSFMPVYIQTDNFWALGISTVLTTLFSIIAFILVRFEAIYGSTREANCGSAFSPEASL